MSDMVRRDENEALASDDFLNSLTETQRRGLIRLADLNEIPETQAELARALNVTDRALRNWWQNEDWCRAVYDLIRRTRVKHLPMIENSLVTEARKLLFAPEGILPVDWN